MAEQKTPRLSKRMKTVLGKVDRNKFYPVDDALKLVKETAVAKFDESVDVAVNLGVDAKKSDQTVRGSVVLPAGTPAVAAYYDRKQYWPAESLERFAALRARM